MVDSNGYEPTHRPVVMPRRARLTVRAGLFALFLGCGGSAEPHAHSAGYLSVPWTASLRPSLGGASVFAAVALLSDVEELRPVGDGLVARRLPRPGPAPEGCTYATPLELAPVDVDQDGVSDLVVHDFCASSIVWQAQSEGTSAATDSSSWLPGDGPYEYLETMQRTDKAVEMAVGSTRGFSFIRSGTPASPWQDVGQFGVSKPLGRTPTRGVVPVTGADLWIVAGLNTLYTVGWLGEQPQIQDYLQSAPTPPNVIPFDYFDDLTSIGTGSCGTFAVAIGRFVRPGGGPPPWLEPADLPSDFVTISLDPASTAAVVSDVEPNFQAQALGVVAWASGRWIVGVLGFDGGIPAFSAYILTPCEPPVLLGRINATIPSRRPPAPGLGTPLPFPTARIPLAGLRDTDSAVFLTYDGYQSGVFRVTAGASNWAIEEVVFNVHENRMDLSFP
jgi:hypothetical protein